MADHSPADNHDHQLRDHRETYEGFITGSIVLTFVSFLILVALVSFRFGESLNVVIGFAGLVIGFIAVAIDARMGSRWFLSLGVLVVFGLITAINIS